MQKDGFSNAKATFHPSLKIQEVKSHYLSYCITAHYSFAKFCRIYTPSLPSMFLREFYNVKAGRVFLFYTQEIFAYGISVNPTKYKKNIKNTIKTHYA